MTNQTFLLLRHSFAVWAFIAFVSTQDVFSQQVNFSYSGFVQDGSTSGTVFLPGVPDIVDNQPFDAFNGQEIALVFSLDVGLVDSNDSANVGAFSPVLDYEVQIGDTVFTPSPSSGTVSVFNLSADTFQFSGNLEGPTLVGVDTYSSARVDLTFRDSSGLIFENDALPSTQLLASDFSSAQLDVIFFGEFGGRGNVGTDLLAVPEPSSSIVILFAIGASSVLRRRRNAVTLDNE